MSINSLTPQGHVLVLLHKHVDGLLVEEVFKSFDGNVSREGIECLLRNLKRRNKIFLHDRRFYHSRFHNKKEQIKQRKEDARNNTERVTLKHLQKTVKKGLTSKLETIDKLVGVTGGSLSSDLLKIKNDLNIIVNASL